MSSMYEPVRGSTLRIYQDLHLVVLHLKAPKDDGADGCFNMEPADARLLAQSLIEHADAIDTVERAKRRRDLAYSLDPRGRCLDYGSHSGTTRAAIDRIIALEDKVANK